MENHSSTKNDEDEENEDNEYDEEEEMIICLHGQRILLLYDGCCGRAIGGKKSHSVQPPLYRLNIQPFHILINHFVLTNIYIYITLN